MFNEIWYGRRDFADSELKATATETLGASVRLVVVREGSILEFCHIVRSSVFMEMQKKSLRRVLMVFRTIFFEVVKTFL